MTNALDEPIKSGDSVRPRTGKYAEHEGIVSHVMATDDSAHPYPIMLAYVSYPGLNGRIGIHDTRYLNLIRRATGGPLTTPPGGV